MPPLNIPRHATILVCDARKALLFRNEGDGDLPDLRLTESLEAEANPKTAEQGSDRPGRLSDGAAGTQRSAVEQTDWHDQAEAAFASQLSSLLEQRHRAAPGEALIIVAPPHLLGDLRKRLPASVAGKVVSEIAKDLVNQPVDAIERALTGRS